MAKDNKKKPAAIRNKKAAFEYQLGDRFVAGIVLQGSEIKSIRDGNANINDAYCLFSEGRVIVKNMHISEFRNAGYAQHEPLRDRILLLNRNEVKKITTKLKDKGVTIVPLELFISETGYAKLQIALARGKKSYDKREDLKTKDLKRDMDRDRY